MLSAKTLVGAGVCAFAALQLVPAVPRENPPIQQDRTIENHLDLPPQVKAILDRSCRDCHSDETRWPWYARVAPASWLIARDVNKARGVMNFSRWSDKADEKLDRAIGLLTAACTDVTIGRMPKPDYALLHSEAKLTRADIDDFCWWSKSEGKRLIIARKKKLAK